MSKRRINNNCQSPLNSEKLFMAKKSVRQYYNVNSKSYLQLCIICREKCELYNNRRNIQTRTQSINRPHFELKNLTENEKSIAVVNSDITREDGIIKIIELPANCPKPISYIDHQCSRSCVSRITFKYTKTKHMNALSIPLLYGFTRYVTSDENLELKKVTYTAPCGLKINDEHAMFKYLKVTGYGERKITIDLFSFDCVMEPMYMLDVQKKFIRLNDISYGTELKPITVVNCFDAVLPKQFKYITECETININNCYIKHNFSYGCNCNDNCEDKTKCSCWQLTYEGPKNYPKMFKDPNVGYSYKRLHEPVFTGIFECNTHCKCSKTCLNRVAQEPIKTSLQLFFSKKKGWGVRTLGDIPKGSFICTLIGVVRTDKDIDNNCETNKYLANLDFIRASEEIKDGYESSEYQSEEIKNSSESSDGEEYNPGSAVKSKNNMITTIMSLSKRARYTNTKIDVKHKLSKLNTRRKVESNRYSLLKQVNKDDGLYTLDAEFRGNIGRFFNHSCDPNIFIQNVFIDTHDLRFPTVAHFALTNIPAGAELAWNYNYIIENVKNKKKIKCYCGSKNCKGRLL
ncbi:hypothetical protein QTP88_027283 [Uroleucon formosanum]